MNYTVGVLWIIYIIVVVVSFLIFWLLTTVINNHYSKITALGLCLCLATLLGAITVFIGAFWFDPGALDVNEKTWLSVLFVIAFLLPLIVIIIILWRGDYYLKEAKCVKWKNC